MHNFWLKVIVTTIGVLLIAAHLIWPAFKVDFITLGLLIMALLPWYSSLIESAEFPGGWKVKFRDVQSAADKITGAKTDAYGTADTMPAYLQVKNDDPNLALAGLRIEIEKRIRALAEQHGIDASHSLIILLQELRHGHIIDNDFYEGACDLVQAGNRAVHGAKVEDQVASWAFERGPQVLFALNRKLAQ